MIYRILLKEEAKNDIQDAFLWYESQQIGLGNDFIDEFETYIQILETNPQAFQARTKDRRFCPMKRFPYLLIYEIEQSDVIIYAVFNTFQHPSSI